MLAVWDTCLEVCGATGRTLHVHLTLSECGGDVSSPGLRAEQQPSARRALTFVAKVPLSPPREGPSRHTGLPPTAPPPLSAASPLCSPGWESPRPLRPLQYKVLLYSLDGRLLSAYCAYEWSLGVKSVAWSPSSQFLAVGSYDGKVRPEQHAWG